MKKAAGLVARQRIGRPHPAGLELLGLVGHRRLAFGHARHQEGHVEALGQVAVGDPVREGEDLVGRQQQAARRALVGEATVLAAVLRSIAATSSALTGRPSAWRASSTPSSSKLSRMAAMACVSCTGSACGRRVAMARALRVGFVDAAARETRRRRARSWRSASAASSAPRCPPGVSRSSSTVAAARSGRRFALGMEKLGGADHGSRLSESGVQSPCAAAGA